MLITPELLCACVPDLSLKKSVVYAPILMEVCRRYGITSRRRLAAFLAQVGHESMSFHYTSEIASGAAYDNRKDLGNTLPEAIALADRAGTSTGRRFKGHGLIQITGYSNHLACSFGLYGDDRLARDPILLTKPQDAAMSAGWFWARKSLNDLADSNTHEMFLKLTKRINGGYNGLTDRLDRWTRAKKVLGT